MLRAGLRDVVRRYRLRRIARELVEAAESCAQLRSDLQGSMSSRRELEALFLPEEPTVNPTSPPSAVSALSTVALNQCSYSPRTRVVSSNSSSTVNFRGMIFCWSA